MSSAHGQTPERLKTAQRSPNDDPLAFLSGGGEMGERTRSFDWAQAPVGPVETWPQGLKTAVGICLGSRYPIVLWWGNSAYTMFYNDAYISFLGVTKHPGWLGRSGKECWREIWPTIGPMLESVFATGEATWSEDLLLVLDRNLPREEGYFTFSYSPLRDDAGAVGGIFCTCYETTARVIGERRLRTLRDLGRTVMAAKSTEEACEVTARTLAANPADIPFALIYLLDGEGRSARLVAATALEAGAGAAPAWIDLGDQAAPSTGWPLRRVFDSTAAELVSDPSTRFGPLPGGPWPESPNAALVLPIAAPGQARPTGFLVAGLSPRQVVDADYRSFFDLIAGHIATAVANARAYEAEKRRAEQLAELDRAKTAFFTNISHEFRTPLTLILGPLEDALAETKEGEHRDRLELLHRNTLRLQKLVNTLLDFSRIEAGRIQASYESTDLAVFTSELASVFRSAIEKAGMRLIVDCPPLGEPVYVDRDIYEKIVLNLLSNAFKFTLEGTIEVRLRDADATVELSIRDTGTGIAKEELPHVFERFHRVEGARVRTHEGTGIGLALVQEMVKLHGGSVHVESAAGQGSVFTVKLPKGKAHLPSERIGASRRLASTALAADHYLEEALRWLPSDVARGAGREASEEPKLHGGRHLSTPPSPSATSNGPRIVWADDNADMRDYVSRLLSPLYDVEAVPDGEAALAAVRNRLPDLVLADVMMPRLDGFGLLKELRADPRTRSLPVILVSARAGEESRVEGMEAGADDYLVKPFSARDLLARVHARLEMARVRREASETVRGSEERLRQALSAGKFGNWQLDLADLSLTCSDQCKANFGYEPGETFTYEMFRASIHPDDQAAVAAEIARALERVGDYEAEYHCVWPDGSIHWINARGRAIAGPDGRAARMVGLTLDITERKRTEGLLLVQKQTFEMAASGAPLMEVLESLAAGVEKHSDQQPMVAIHLLDESGTRFERTASVTLHGGYVEAADGMPVRSMSGPCCAAIVRNQRVAVPDVANDTEFPKFAAFALSAGIRAGWSTPIVSSNGKVLGTIAHYYRKPRQPAEEDEALAEIVTRTASIVIERKQAEEQLQRSQKVLFELVERCPFGIYIVDSNFTITTMNKGGQDGAFINVRPVIGRPFDEAMRILWPAEVAQRIITAFHHTLETGEPYYSRDFVEPRADNEQVEGYEWELHQIELPDGSKGVICYYFDATHLRATERALRQQEALTRGQKEAFQATMNGEPLETSLGVLVRSVKDLFSGKCRAAFYTINGDGKSLHHVTGMPEAYARRVEGFAVGPESLACGLATHRGEPVITPDVNQEPRWQPWRWLAREHNYRACWSFPVRSAGGPILGTLALYFPDRREPTAHEMALMPSLTHAAAIIVSRHTEVLHRTLAEQRWRTLTETLPNLVWTGLPDGQCDWLSSQWGKYTGIPENDLLGLRWVETVLHPDDRERTLACWMAACADGGAARQRRCRECERQRHRYPRGHAAESI